MFGGIRKMFGTPPASEANTASPVASAAPPPAATSFLRRDAIFDRSKALVGHLFRTRREPGASAIHHDLALLGALAAGTPGPGLAFVPLRAPSLDLPDVDRLAANNLVLLVHLTEPTQPAALCQRLTALRERGIRIALIRQPRHPAFTDAVQLADIGAVDVSATEPDTLRDFSAALRAIEKRHPVSLFGFNIETADEYRLCHQWHFGYFHGRFASDPSLLSKSTGSDPHKLQLLNLMRLVQGDAENPDIVAAMKQDPILAFRILRYLNSPALGLNHPVDSLSHALIILGRQRLARWLAVLLFSVRSPDIGDWLLVEGALTRGRIMEELAAEACPDAPRDALFLTGIFSCLDRLLRQPLADCLAGIPLAPPIRDALLDRSGPYVPLLAVAEASEEFDVGRMADAAARAGLAADQVNRALLAATAWASEVTEHWE